MRNISFSMTTPQFIDGSKDVTRRLGWWKLKPGDRLMAVEKAMGLKKGEKIKPLGVIEIVSVSAEPLSAITEADVKREGFPGWTRADFINFFTEKNPKCGPFTLVNRIEFKKVGQCP